MATTFNRATNEDFEGMIGLGRNLEQTVNPDDTVKIMSRMGHLGEDHAAVQNYDRLNMDLTKMYACRNATHLDAGGDSQQLYLAWDQRYTLNTNSDRGPFDRYAWAGQFQKKAANDGGTVFTHSTIDGTSTDGMMLIPSPYANFTPGGHSYWGDANFESIRLTIKSNRAGGIPKNKFVPLFGYTYSCAGAPQTITNSSGTAYRNNTVFTYKNGTGDVNGNTTTQNAYRLDGAIPNAISASTDNLDEWSNVASNAYQNWFDYARNTTVWFLYAHDDNGNGMIIMTAGEGATSEHFESSRLDGYNRYRPHNGHFGNKDGYLKFKQPYYLAEWFSQGKTLTDLNNEWGIGGDGREGFDDADFRKASSIRHIYRHWRDMNDSTIGGYENSVRDGNPNISTHGHANAGYHYYFYNKNQWSNGNIANGNLPNSSHFGAFNYAPFQIVAFGNAGNNATLADSEEILINANTIGVAGKNYHRYLGIQSYNDQNATSQARHGTARQILYTGKILSFNFRDVPGQMWNDYYRLYYSTAWYATQHTSKGPYALALRPTFEDEMQVEKISYANYTNDDAPEVIGGDTLLKDTYRSSSSTQFFFGGDGYSYDPLQGAKSNPTDVVDNEDAWDNEANIIDQDLNSRAQLNAVGHANALHIKLSGTDATLTQPEGDFDITSMGITVRGITLSAIDYHKLRFAIVDSDDINNQTTFFETVTSTQVEQQDRLDIGDIPIGNTTISPVGDGAYHIQFQTTLSSNHSYADIKNAFLKIWAEKI